MKRVFVILILASCALAAQQHSVTLTWTAGDTNNNPADTYNVYKATGACSGSPTFARLASTAPGVLTYVDLAVVQSATYCYAVTASWGGLESGKSPFLSAVIPGGFPPVAPPSLTGVVQ